LAKDLFCFVREAECVGCRYQTVLSGDNIKQIRENACTEQTPRSIGHVRPQIVAPSVIK